MFSFAKNQRYFSLFFLLFAAAVLLAPATSHAFGLSPSRVDLGEIYRGETVRTEVNITTNKDEAGIVIGYRLTSTAPDAIVTYPKEIERHSQKNFVAVPIEIHTAAAASGENTVNLIATPVYPQAEEMVALSISLPLKISFTVTDKKVEDIAIESAYISEENKNQTLHFSVRNKGNSTYSLKSASLVTPFGSDHLAITATIAARESDTFSVPLRDAAYSPGMHTMELRIEQEEKGPYAHSFSHYVPRAEEMTEKNQSKVPQIAAGIGGIIAISTICYALFFLIKKK